MIKYGVNCALEPVAENAPVVLRGNIENIAKTAAEIGYNGLELFIRDPGNYSGRQLEKVADEHGIEFCAIATGMEYTKNGLCLIDDNPASRVKSIDRLKEHIDLAQQLDCAVIVGIMRGNINDFSKYNHYLGLLSEALQILSQYAKESGVMLYIEAIMRYVNNYLCTVDETADYVRSLGLDNLKLHIDSHLMNVEDRDIKKSILASRDVLGYVHLSDSNRAYPGGGSFDFKAMMNTLQDIGYNGYATVECQPYPTQTDCALRGLQYMRHLEGLLEIERAPVR